MSDRIVPIDFKDSRAATETVPLYNEGEHQTVARRKKRGGGVAIRSAAKCWKEMNRQERQALFESLPPEKQQAARLKAEIVTRWEREKEDGGMLKKEFIEWVRITYDIKISATNLWNWSEKYKQFQIYGLVDIRGYAQKPGRKIVGWLKEYIDRVWFSELGNVRPQHLWVAIHAKAFHDGLIPSFRAILNKNAPERKNGSDWQLVDRASVTRYLKKLEKQNASLLRAMNNPDRFDGSCEPAFGSACADITHTNQRWEIDASPLDIMTMRPMWNAKPVQYRYSLISVVDRWSRMAVMDIVETSNILSVSRVLWKAVNMMGLPEEIVIDNGKEYISDQISAGFRHLGIWVITARPFKGKDKPYVERIFGSFQTAFSENMPGFIGHSVSQRVQIESRTPKSQRLSGAKTNQTALPVEDVREQMEAWLRHVYANTYNAGLNASPAEAYMRGLRGEPRQVTRDEFMFCFGERKKVSVTKKGVRWRNIPYQSPELAAITGEKVELVLDLDDVHRAFVFQGGKLICSVRDAEQDPLTAEERKDAARLFSARKRKYREAVKFARQELGDDADRVSSIISAAQKEMENGGFEEMAEIAREMPIPARSKVDELIEAKQQEKLARLAENAESLTSSELRQEVRRDVPDLTDIIDLAQKRKAQEAEKDEPKPLKLKDLMGI